MKISDIATPHIHCVEPGDSLDTAICLMEEHQIHHLPVVDRGVVCGMISDRDLLISVGWMLEIERMADRFDRQFVGPRCVGDVMSAPVSTVSPQTEIRDCARIMAERKIHALPVVNSGRMIGIATRMDLLRWSLSPGAERPGLGFLRDSARKHMHCNVFSVSPGETLHAVSRIMKEKHIRHVLVMTEGMLLGIISDRDVRRACGVEAIEDGQAEARGELYVGAESVVNVMSRQLRVVAPDATLRAVVELVIEAKIGCVPVLNDAEFLGLLTDTDLLHLIANGNRV